MQGLVPTTHPAFQPSLRTLTLSKERTLEVGLIGFGLGGSTFHAPFISITPGLRLAAILTRDPERSHAAHEKYPEARIARDIDDLLGGPTPLDLVVISSPNATHHPLATAVLSAGAHVVVDKPFAITSALARELGALAARVGKLAMPFQNRRWDGDFLTLQQLISDDKLGTVHRFESRFDRWRVPPKPGWCRPDARERAEGIVHDLGTHLIDQALVLFGPVATVYAEMHRRAPGIVTEDDVFLSLEHVGGVQSHLYMSTRAGLPGLRLHVTGSHGAYVKYGLDVQEDALRAGAKPGGAEWGVESDDRWGTLGAGPDSERVPTLPGTYQSYYQGVAAAILTGAPPPVAIAEVVAGLEVIEAAFASRRTHNVVALDA